MPLYDFQCSQCQHAFEDIIKLEDPHPACPICRAPTEKTFGNNTAYHQNDSIKFWEMRNKMQMIKGKMQGRIPWNRSKESQSS